MASQQQQDPSAEALDAAAPSAPADNEQRAATQSSPAPPVDTPPTPDEVAVRVPGFAALQDDGQRAAAVPMDRFYDVNVTVWAELGRTAMPIGELLQLGEGAVLKLSRSVSEPIDLVAQGVRLARGEVVVVDDCFAVRIKEIESSEKT